MDQPGIAVEIEDDRLVCREETIELTIREPVGMLTFGLQAEEVDALWRRANPAAARPSPRRASVMGSGTEAVMAVGPVADRGPSPASDSPNAVGGAGEPAIRSVS